LWSAPQAFAQINAGSKFVGGSLSYRMSASPDRTNNTFYSFYSIRPSVGYLVQDRLALGVNVGFEYGFSEDDSPTIGRVIEESTAYSIGSSLTWFVPVSEEKFWFTLQGGVNYSRSYRESIAYSTDSYVSSDYYSIGVSVSPGFLFLPSPRWAVTLGVGGLGYSHKRGIGNEITENDVSFNLGQFSLGVLYFF
jgi:hypothetical protein